MIHVRGIAVLHPLHSSRSHVLVSMRRPGLQVGIVFKLAIWASRFGDPDLSLQLGGHRGMSQALAISRERPTQFDVQVFMMA